MSPEKNQMKSPQESKVEMIQQVMPGDSNSLGTVFGGQVMAWVDMAAAVSAMRHVRGPVVTASIDAVDFHVPARVGHIMVLNAQVNFVGRTSMEIGVEVKAEDPMTGQQVITTEALLTFVAIDQKCKPVPIPKLILKTDDEKERFEAGKKRKEERIARKNN